MNKKQYINTNAKKTKIKQITFILAQSDTKGALFRSGLCCRAPSNFFTMFSFLKVFLTNLNVNKD